MNWINFQVFAVVAAILWVCGAVSVYFTERNDWFRKLFHISMIGGILVLGAFLAMLWHNVERPPMRTLGETRLWYSLFLPIIGYITVLRWKYKWFLSYSVGLAILFLYINSRHPETWEKEMMPALQSLWFVPHVIVYIFSYALLGASSLVALKGIYEKFRRQDNEQTLVFADNLVYTGFSFLTLGLIFGAFWAKRAWGHYWTWDPKETWALLTWLIYIAYIHLRKYYPQKTNTHLTLLAFAFAVLLLCWFGMSYLPTAGNSVHVYAQ